MRSLCDLRCTAGFALAVAVALLVAVPAPALQLSGNADEPLNELGTSHVTSPDSVHYDQVSSTDPHPGELAVSGGVPELSSHTRTSRIHVNPIFRMLLASLDAGRIHITPAPAEDPDGVKATVASVSALSTSQIVIPEPATLLLMGLGLAGLAALTRMLPDSALRPETRSERVLARGNEEMGTVPESCTPSGVPRGILAWKMRRRVRAGKSPTPSPPILFRR